jgi:hypothetical protein
MPGCKPPCVEIVSGTTRQKWNYVRNLYQMSYTLASGTYDYYDSRGVDDPARIMDETAFNQMYQADLDHWMSYHSSKPFELYLQWRFQHGTRAYGNLPQPEYLNKVGHCWMPCPYSTECTDTRTRLMLGLSDTDPLPPKTSHELVDGKKVYLKTASSGAAWGFICTFDGCPHYIANGTRYFYV